MFCYLLWWRLVTELPPPAESRAAIVPRAFLLVGRGREHDYRVALGTYIASSFPGGLSSLVSRMLVLLAAFSLLLSAVLVGPRLLLLFVAVSCCWLLVFFGDIQEGLRLPVPCRPHHATTRRGGTTRGQWCLPPGFQCACCSCPNIRLRFLDWCFVCCLLADALAIVARL